MSENKGYKNIFEGSLCIIAAIAIGFHLNSLLSDNKVHVSKSQNTSKEIPLDTIARNDTIVRISAINQKTR